MRSRTSKQVLQTTRSFSAQQKVLKTVNSKYSANNWKLPEPKATSLAADPVLKVSPEHWEESWDKSSIVDACKQHSTMTWGATDPMMGGALDIARGEGPYLYDFNGKEYIDWTCQAMCTNLGHTVPQEVIDAVTKQFETCAMVYPGFGLTEIRGRLCKLLSEIFPGDLNSFVFGTGGAEANEAAIRMARRFTGKTKILNRYRSYHGASSSALAATGDFRRLYGESASPNGFVKMIDPQPWSFNWGNEEESCEGALNALREQILGEGANSIAAIMLESVSGGAGVFIPPKGYLEGVRGLCDEYGIMMICDEVMAGFGRTGKLFGFQHAGIVPDLVTFAKGSTAAYLPMSGVAMRENIQEFFRTNPLGWGATYSFHPVSMACGYEVIKHIIKNDIVGNVQRMNPVLEREMNKLIEKHPNAILQGRLIGLFGCLDLAGPDGNYAHALNEPPPERILKFKAALREEGVYMLFRTPHFHCVPALNITEEQIVEGCARIDRAMAALD